MNQKPDKQYQALFQGMAISPEKTKILRDRIAAELQQRAHGTAGSHHCWPRLAFFNLPRLAGMAAAIALIVAGWHVLFPGALRHATPCDNGGVMTISAERQADGARLFGELAALFGKQLDWVCESNGKMQMGIEPDVTTAASDSPPMLVRVDVLRRRGDGEWCSYLQTDIMIRGEHFAEIIPAAHPQTRLHLWMAPTSDGRIAVDTTLFMDNGAKLVSWLNAVVPEGQAQEMAHLKSNDRYRVFQTIRRLDSV